MNNEEDYLTSLCVQWSLEFSTDNIIEYIDKVEDLSIQFRNKIHKEYVSELHLVNSRTIKEYFDFVSQMNNIYVISKLILFNSNNKDFMNVIKEYANERNLDFTDFLDIVENLHYSAIELANKYWK